MHYVEPQMTQNWGKTGSRVSYDKRSPSPPGIERSPRAHSIRAARLGLMSATTIGLVLGALTDWGQSRLPWYAGSLANSAGSWVLVAFFAALGGSRIRLSVGRGVLCMVGLNLGYYITAAARGIPISASAVSFWLVAAAVFGPVVGLAAGWVRHGGSIQIGAGSGILAGFLAGESIYALRYLSHSTTTTYWTIQLLVAVALGVGLALRASRRAPSLFASALACALVAGVICATEVRA
jgi:hypothetical protein